MARMKRTGTNLGRAHPAHRRETTKVWVARIEQSLRVG